MMLLLGQWRFWANDGPSPSVIPTATAAGWDLSVYGFYALEAAVDAVCLYTGIDTARHHAARAIAAAALASSHGLPDVSELLRDLNEGRKHQSYGDVDAPDLSV